MSDNARPMDSAPNQSKTLGIVCPACGRPACGKIPVRRRRKLLAADPDRKPKNVAYTRRLVDCIQRVRACVHCGHRFLTAERVVSNRV